MFLCEAESQVSGSCGDANPEKVHVVHDFPTPKNIKELRVSMGLANYYRRFCEGLCTHR